MNRATLAPTSDDLAPTTIIAIAVVQDGQRFLIGQRPAGVPLSGYWEFPGGKVGPDETPSAAVLRECQEETGLEVCVGQLLAEVEHEYSHGRLRLYFFLCAPLDASRPPNARFRWVERSDLERYDFPEANQSVIARLITGD